MEKSKERISTLRETTYLPRTLEAQLAVLPSLVPVYQKAFAGEPWFEVSKCACARGFSAQRVGERCIECGQKLSEEAYPPRELLQSLEKRIAENQPSAVYVEAAPEGGAPILGAISFRAAPQEIYRRKYAGRENPRVQGVLERAGKEIAWLDEIFADRLQRSSGNLWNFEKMCLAIGKGASALAFRTINPRLAQKAWGVFGSCSTAYVFEDPGTIQGSSSLVVINLDAYRSAV